MKFTTTFGAALVLGLASATNEITTSSSSSSPTSTLYPSPTSSSCDPPPSCTAYPTALSELPACASGCNSYTYKRNECGNPNDENCVCNTRYYFERCLYANDCSADDVKASNCIADNACHECNY